MLTFNQACDLLNVTINELNPEARSDFFGMRDQLDIFVAYADITCPIFVKLIEVNKNYKNPKALVNLVKVRMVGAYQSIIDFAQKEIDRLEKGES
jgi:hypothetical protein